MIQASGNQASGNQSVTSVDQAFAILDGYGVTYFNLKQTGSNPSNWKFDCMVPNKQTPGTGPYIEAEGVGPHGIGALQEAIHQIKQMQGGN